MADPSLFDIFISGVPTACAQTTNPPTTTKDEQMVLDAAKTLNEPILDAVVSQLVDIPKLDDYVDMADNAAAVASEAVVPTKEKKIRKPRAPKKASGGSSVKKGHHDKTTKEAVAAAAATPVINVNPQPESRHCPGYSMLRVERDKIERSRQALIRKNETRASQGKPAPTVCSILNDTLIEFYSDVSTQFDARFGKYLKN